MSQWNIEWESVSKWYCATLRSLWPTGVFVIDYTGMNTLSSTHRWISLCWLQAPNLLKEPCCCIHHYIVIIIIVVTFTIRHHKTSKTSLDIIYERKHCNTLWNHCKTVSNPRQSWNHCTIKQNHAENFRFWGPLDLFSLSQATRSAGPIGQASTKTDGRSAAGSENANIWSGPARVKCSQGNNSRMMYVHYCFVKRGTSDTLLEKWTNSVVPRACLAYSHSMILKGRKLYWLVTHCKVDS